VPNACRTPVVAFLHCVLAAVVHSASVVDFFPVLSFVKTTDNFEVLFLQLAATIAVQVASFAPFHALVPISTCAPLVSLHLVAAVVDRQVPSVVDVFTFSPDSASKVLSAFLQFPLPRVAHYPLVLVVHP
jgi:hypothetical protein